MNGSARALREHLSFARFSAIAATFADGESKGWLVSLNARVFVADHD